MQRDGKPEEGGNSGKGDGASAQHNEDAQHFDDLTSLQQAPAGIDNDARGDVRVEGEVAGADDPSLF
ncbi:MAG: hypothetical protein EXR29_12935 [Betaproteobacteria bacterium]|nr:hypothetical protein [Betaproteobacteria bacterium]